MRHHPRAERLFRRFRDTTSASFFEAKYQAEPDPWKFETNPYELGRYRTILAALGDRHYRRAFEPGCSVGVLTEQRAARCDAVEACDLSPTAVETARKRCLALPHVSLSVGPLTAATAGERMAAGGFDLVVMSEIGYYFPLRELRPLLDELINPLPAGGTFLASHWLGSSGDHILSGDQVHETLMAHPRLQHEHGERHEGFRLDRWVRI